MLSILVKIDFYFKLQRICIFFDLKPLSHKNRRALLAWMNGQPCLSKIKTSKTLKPNAKGAFSKISKSISSLPSKQKSASNKTLETTRLYIWRTECGRFSVIQITSQKRYCISYLELSRILTPSWSQISIQTSLLSLLYILDRKFS